MSQIVDFMSFFRGLNRARFSHLQIGAKPWQPAPSAESYRFFELYQQFAEESDQVHGIESLFSTDLSALQYFAVKHGYPADILHEPLDFGGIAFADLVGDFYPHQAQFHYSDLKLRSVLISDHFQVRTLTDFGSMAIINPQPIRLSNTSGYRNKLLLLNLDTDTMSELELVNFGLQLINQVERSSDRDQSYDAVEIPMVDLVGKPNVSQFLQGAFTVDVTGQPCLIQQAAQIPSFRLKETGFQAKVISAYGGLRSAITEEPKFDKVFQLRPPFFGCILQHHENAHASLGCSFPLLPFLVTREDCRYPE